LRIDKGGHQYQALDRFILQEVLACRRRWARLRLQLEQKQVVRPLRIVTVSGAQEEVRRNSVEAETNKGKCSICDVAVTCDDVRCFL